MDMTLDWPEVETLPSGELKFLNMIAGLNLAAYGVGYVGEQATLAQLQNHFRYLNEFANVALLRVGSGGRFEGAALGDAEFVLLTKDTMGPEWEPGVEGESGWNVYPSQFFETLESTAGTDIIGIGLTSYMKVSLERKRLEGPDLLSYYPGNPTPYPGRILEGEYVAGNPALVTEARRKAFTEIASEPKIISGMKEDLKVHQKVCETGLSRKVPQFNLDTDELYFNPPARQFGMKYSLLRYVQTALSIELFELFQRRQFPIDEYLDLNQGVEERIRYALRKGWVANEEDLVAAGLIYLQATDVNSIAKIQYYTDHTKTVSKLQPGDLRMLHNDVVELFQSRLLVG